MLLTHSCEVARADDDGVLVLCEVEDTSKNRSTKVTYPCFTKNKYIVDEIAEDWPTTENSNVWSIITGVLSAVIAGALVFCGSVAIREARKHNRREERQEVQDAIEKGRPLPPKDDPPLVTPPPTNLIPKSRRSGS